MRPRLLPAVLDLGLAGALLGELIMMNRLGQLDGYLLAAVRPPERSGRPYGEREGDTITDQVLDLIAGKPAQPVSVWLGQIRHLAADGVRDRLVDAGVLSEVTGRKWWGGAMVEYRALDPNQAMGPEAGVFGLVSSHRPLDTNLQAVTLAGLVDVTGLRTKMPAWDMGASEVHHRMVALRSGLPAPLRGLLADLETAVGAALLSSGHH